MKSKHHYWFKQVSLFDNVSTKPSKPEYYLDLNINQRINVKANSLGFARVFIRHGFRYYSTLRHDDIFTHLLYNKLKWDNDHNHGGKLGVRLNTNKKKSGSLF